MKLNINRKKLRFGSISVVMTVLIIVAVMLLNVLFMIAESHFGWKIDMTSDKDWSLSERCKEVINQAMYDDDGALKIKDNKITIYFCDDPDNLKNLMDESNTNVSMGRVYGTATDLAATYDFIEIKTLDWEYNPTSVLEFTKTGNIINSQSVIVKSGEKYRVYSLADMFVYDNSLAWAYDGERKLTSAILAVSSVEQPVAYITMSHSEQYYDSALVELLYDAGYKILFEGGKDEYGHAVPELSDKLHNPFLDYTMTDENGEKYQYKGSDIKLVVVYNPRSDFGSASAVSADNEINRLNGYLERNNSMMVFMDPNSPVLQNFEEWLANYWGVTFNRKAEGDNIVSYMVNDRSTSLDNAGYIVKGVYDTKGGVGYSLYSNMLSSGKVPPVYFEHSMPISFSQSFPITRYEHATDHSRDFDFGFGSIDGSTRQIFNVFSASNSAVAVANGTVIDQNTDLSGLGSNPFRLMTITSRENTIQDTKYFGINQNAYVLACGSTKFATKEYLESAVYGNSDVLLSATVIMGRDNVPVNVDFKPFKSFDISDISDAAANNYTILLAAIPAVTVMIVCTVVLIRRKYS